MVLSFTMNKQNYAWYGIYYLRQIVSLEGKHPGAHEEIQENGNSVCRNNTSIRESVDGAREQTFMRNSKIAGNYLSFLMCSREIFTEEANIFFLCTSQTTRNYFISNHTILSYFILSY